MDRGREEGRRDEGRREKGEKRDKQDGKMNSLKSHDWSHTSCNNFSVAPLNVLSMGVGLA